VAGALFDMGCYEVSMGDTTGTGTPASVTAMLEATTRAVPIQHVAAHLHDTYGQVRAEPASGSACACPPSSMIDSRVANILSNLVAC